jgi:ACS family hexuronate transporter-like MFS transporter
MAGAIGGMCIAKAVGYILQHTGSYVPVFVMAGVAYLIAFSFVQVLAPRLKPAQV